MIRSAKLRQFKISLNKNSHLKTVSDLKILEKGIIRGFTDHLLSVKLMEMGCLPGTEVLMELVAPLGDPLAIRVSGYYLSLRKDEAASIILED